MKDKKDRVNRRDFLRTVGAAGIGSALAFSGCGIKGDMDKAVVPVADEHFGSSGHAGMDGVSAQKTAEHVVVGIGRQASDHVTGIDVFQGDFSAFFIEVGGDFIL